MPEITVAAALENAGRRALRRSVGGEPRGVLCAMGICFECRVEIGGVPHRRACMEMERSRRAAPDYESVDLDGDLPLVGAGPAGVSAACRAAEAGARTVLLDENPAPGGQIHRHLPGKPAPEAARAWLERLASSGALLRNGMSIVDGFAHRGGFRLFGEGAGGGLATVSARRVVLATGARELFLPFPGWTLPGVMGAGGAQAMAKMGADFRGRTAVVAGSGPLLLPVAAYLEGAGAEVALVAEQAGFGALGRFLVGLARRPDKLVEAAGYRSRFFPAPYRSGTWIAEAHGKDSVEAVTVTDGSSSYRIDCDLAAVGYGLVPNTELARLLGAALRAGVVEVDAAQETSIPGVFAAGEPCGVAGLETAIAEGELAGLSAADRLDAESAEARRLGRKRGSGRRLAAAMERAFRPRADLAAAVRGDTIVCRCEDVRLSDAASASGAREAKLSARAGMGPCQGRVCGPALAFLFGWDSDTVRPPVKPASFGSLAAMTAEDSA